MREFVPPELCAVSLILKIGGFVSWVAFIVSLVSFGSLIRTATRDRRGLTLPFNLKGRLDFSPHDHIVAV